MSVWGWYPGALAHSYTLHVDDLFVVNIHEGDRFTTPRGLTLLATTTWTDGVGETVERVYRAFEDTVVIPEEHFTSRDQSAFDEYVADLREFLAYRSQLEERYASRANTPRTPTFGS